MSAEILAELKRINARLDALKTPKVMLTRREAADELRVSIRQLHRLVAAGRLIAHPSGIARAELERYAKTPQTALPKAMTRPMRERSAVEEGERLSALLRSRSRRR